MTHLQHLLWFHVWHQFLLDEIQNQLLQFKKILPEGENLGIKIKYAQQKYPKGLPDAFVIGEKFIDKDNIA